MESPEAKNTKVTEANGTGAVDAGASNIKSQLESLNQAKSLEHQRASLQQQVSLAQLQYSLQLQGQKTALQAAKAAFAGSLSEDRYVDSADAVTEWIMTDKPGLGRTM
jgi:hypothetical protein